MWRKIVFEFRFKQINDKKALDNNLNSIDLIFHAIVVNLILEFYDKKYLTNKHIFLIDFRRDNLPKKETKFGPFHHAWPNVLRLHKMPQNESFREIFDEDYL